MKNSNLLVSGASGQSGTLIVKALAARQQPIRALVRSRTNASFLADLPNVDVTVGDMLEKDSLKAALDGIDRAILLSSANESMVETQCSFIDACKKAGVGHVIKFSGEEAQRGYDPYHFRFTREHEQIEDYLENSGMSWTHLRPSQFMQVYLREAPTIIQNGELRLSLGEISMSPVDLCDVAQVAAELLQKGGHHGKSLRMTGPEALKMADIAAIFSSIAGKPVSYVQVSWEERRNFLVSAGFPLYLIDALAEQAAERCRNPEGIVDLDTHRLFDIAPTSFEAFASAHAFIFGKA